MLMLTTVSRVVPERLRSLAKLAVRHGRLAQLPLVTVDATAAVWTILSERYGFTRSVVAGRCLDAQGQSIPWYTYPAIEALTAYDFSRCDIFEYGAGASTRWWADRAKSVTSVESQASWVRELQPTLPANARVVLQEDRRAFIDAIDRPYDVIVIDGPAGDGMRYDCAWRSRPFLKDGGAIIVDNSEWLPLTCQYLRDTGLLQIDFNGFVPINVHTGRTSLFLSQPCRIPYRVAAPPPIGWFDADWETPHVTKGRADNSAPLAVEPLHAQA